MVHQFDLEFAGRPLRLEVGRLAEQANGAVLVQYGETVLLAAVTAAPSPREGIDFFPLTVDYEERMYAAGKIPGNFFRREGRPTENAILTARLTDRPLRPLFPKDFRNEVQIIVTVLSYDGENDPDTLCLLGASAALTISDIPFDGPVASVRVGVVDGRLALNPTVEQQADSVLDLVVAGTASDINMLEAGARVVPEATLIEAIAFGHAGVKELIALQQKMRAQIGRAKFSYPSFGTDHALGERVRSLVGSRIDTVLDTTEKHARAAAATALARSVAEHIGAAADAKAIGGLIEELEAEGLRQRILKHGRRPDGRGVRDLRPISCAVGVLPRTHGTGLFQRGQTQVLSIATLGSSADEQQVDSLGLDETKRYMHHYNMPPYSVGEVRRTGSPGRREIGHGALAERSLIPVLPKKEDFPYTLRVVSEVVSSNGSTSMGSVCGSSLALMDAGVPISAPVAGISIGLISSEDGADVLLTDIQGIEDHHGDMDFKVAGTRDGVTAIQLDLKVRGLRANLIPEVFERARTARLFILDRMSEAIAAPRPELNRYAPRVMKASIPVDRIGQLIGPGGKNIRGMQETYKVKIDVQEDGTVYIAGTDSALAEKARVAVDLMGRDVEVGQSYMGKVTRLTTFGAFVEILPGKEGLVRIGELAEERIARVEDVVSIGDEIMVKVIEVDPQGRVNLSRRALLVPDDGTPREPAERRPPRDFGDRARPPRRFDGDRPRFDDRPRFEGDRPPREGGFRSGPRPPRPGGFRDGAPPSGTE